MVSLSWTYAAPASNARLLRNGIEVYSGSSTHFTDRDVVAGSTYFYILIVTDQFGQRSVASSTVEAGVNTALNMVPDVTITTWPSPLPSNGAAIIRVCALDGEAQTLELALSVNTGTITSTWDPSIWIYNS